MHTSKEVDLEVIINRKLKKNFYVNVTSSFDVMHRMFKKSEDHREDLFDIPTEDNSEEQHELLICDEGIGFIIEILHHLSISDE